MKKKLAAVLLYLRQFRAEALELYRNRNVTKPERYPGILTYHGEGIHRITSGRESYVLSKGAL